MFHHNKKNKTTTASLYYTHIHTQGEREWERERGRERDINSFAFPGSDLDCSSLSDGWESQKPITDTSEASSSGHILSQHLKESSENSSLQLQTRTSGHFQKNILVHSSESFLIFATPKEFFLLAIWERGSSNSYALRNWYQPARGRGNLGSWWYADDIEEVPAFECSHEFLSSPEFTVPSFSRTLMPDEH